MKKTLLAIGFISTILSANAQNVNIPDANFKAYLVGNTAINTTADSEIQLSEAQSFTGTINCSNLSISNLIGIEAFTSLSGLTCTGNLLTNIDVSANTALTNLVCGYNQLTNLDVSSNTALTVLGCYNNQITNLVVSANTSLTSLNCVYNQLTSLDVSANTALNYLSFSDNQLTTMDVSANTALIQLVCINNQLTNLNLANSNNTNLEYIYAYGNNLTCVQVDDVLFSSNWPISEFQFDSGVSFSENCAAGLEEPLITELIVSPNPTMANISVTTTFATNLEIKNINGMVIQQVPSNGAITIDLTNFASGVYFVRTSGGQTVKFIKE